MNSPGNQNIVVTDIDAFLKKHEEDMQKKQNRKRPKKKFEFNKKAIAVLIVCLLSVAFLSLVLIKAVPAIIKKIESNDIRRARELRIEYISMIEERKQNLFNEGFAVASDSSEENKNGIEYAYINNEGINVFGKVFHSAKPFLSYGVAVVSEIKDDKTVLYGVINKNGDWVIEPEFSYIAPYFDECQTARAKNLTNEFGFINLDGEWVIKPAYRNVGNFNDFGYAAVEKKDGRFAFVDRSGKETCLPDKYSLVELDPSEGVYRIRHKQTMFYGYINAETGELFAECMYKSATPFVNGFGIVQLPSGYTWIDKNGKFVTDSLYQSVGEFNKYGFACATNMQRTVWYLVKSNGEEIRLQAESTAAEHREYSRVFDIGENYFAAWDYIEGYVILNSNGEIVGETSYMLVYSCSDGIITGITHNANFVAMNTEGKVLFKLKSTWENNKGGFVNGLSPVCEMNGNNKSVYYYVNQNGDDVFGKRFASFASSFTNDGYAFVASEENRISGCGSLIDREGNILFTFKHSYLKLILPHQMQYEQEIVNEIVKK